MFDMKKWKDGSTEEYLFRGQILNPETSLEEVRRECGDDCARTYAWLALAADGRPADAWMHSDPDTFVECLATLHDAGLIDYIVGTDIVNFRLGPNAAMTLFARRHLPKSEASRTAEEPSEAFSEEG